MPKTHRRIRHIDNNRNELTKLVGALGLIDDKWGTHGMAGPQHDNLVCCRELVSDPLPVILTCDQESIPPNFIAMPFQQFPELVSDSFVLVRVTYKNLNHAILARPSCRAVRIEGYGTDPFITSRYLVPSNLARKLHPSIK